MTHPPLVRPSSFTRRRSCWQRRRRGGSLAPCTRATEVEGDVRSAAAGTGRQQRRPGRSESAGRRVARCAGASWRGRADPGACRTPASTSASASGRAARGGARGSVTPHLCGASLRTSRRRCSNRGTGRWVCHAPASRVVCACCCARSRRWMGRRSGRAVCRHAPACRCKWRTLQGSEGRSWDTLSRNRCDPRSHS